MILSPICKPNNRMITMTPAMRFTGWLLTLALLAPMASARSQVTKPIFMAINDELHYFVETTLRRYPPPLADFEINEVVLKAALLFDALGAYGIRYDPARDPLALFSKMVEYDSIYVNPPLKVFSNRAAGVEELAVIYAGVLEAAGIASAIAADSEHTRVLFNTGIHKRYAGAVSRDITSYLIKHQQVWLPVDIKMVGKSFQEAWGRMPGAAHGKSYDIIPVRVMIKDKDIGTARVFSSNLSQPNLQRLFNKDKAFFENADSQRKWSKVEHLMKEDHKRAMIHFNRGVQQLQSGRYDAAIAELTKAAELGTDQIQALFFIAKAYGEKKDFENMKKIGLQMVEARKREPRGYQILGLAYHYTGNEEAGRQLLARAKFLETNSLAANQN